MNKPFDLEAFKKGQKALTRDGRVATFVGVCEKCGPWHRLFAHIKGETLARNYFGDGTYANQLEPHCLDLVLVGDDTQELIEALKSYTPQKQAKPSEHSSDTSYRTPLQEFRAAMFC